MRRIAQTLHDFWFEPAPARRLAMLRILVGGFALVYLLLEQDDLMKGAQTDPKLFAPVGVVFGGPVTLQSFLWIYRATLVAGVLFTLGLWHRLSGPAFGGLLLWVFCYRNSWSMIYHSGDVVVLHVILLGLTRSADALALNVHWRKRPPADHSSRDQYQYHWRYGWPVKLICALTVSVYFVTSVAKLAGPLGLSWITGRALRSQMAVDQLRKELLGGSPNAVSYAIYDWLPLFSGLGVGSLALEFLAPLALLNRRLGRFWAINAYLMHWGILLVMHITFRYQLSGVMFAPFFRVERLADLAERLCRKLASRIRHHALVPAPQMDRGLPEPPNAARATLNYDGECGLCDRFVQFVLRHDRGVYFQFATLQSDAGRQQLARLGLPRDDLQTVVLVEDGGSYMRSTATLRVCRRLAGLWPALYVFIIIPARWRDAAYSLVARHRKNWFREPAECPVMRPEWRRRFVG